MATTAGTLFPIRPIVPPFGGDAAIPTYVFPAASATTILDGDLLILTSGKAAHAATGPSGETVIGIASFAATAVDQHLLVHLALPSQLFEGNMIGVDAVTDLASGTYSSHIGIRTSTFLATDPTPDVFCLESTAGTAADDCIGTIRWGRQRVMPDIYGPFDTTVAVINPRVIFTFLYSFWNRTV